MLVHNLFKNNYYIGVITTCSMGVNICIIYSSVLNHSINK